MFLVRKIGLFGGLAAILLSVLAPAVVAAQATSGAARPPLDIMTSPLPINAVTKPGVPVTVDIRVKNNGAQNEFLKVDLLKFGANGSTGEPKLLERDPTKDLFFNWVTFSETTFTAVPNVWKTIYMTISPPKEAAFDYYYAVLFTRANPDHPTGGQSAFEGGVASLVLLSVEAPGSRRSAEVASLTASQKVYEFLPASFTATIRNNGNIHVAPTGTLFIRRGNTQVAALDFNAENGNILPSTDRVFTLDWRDGFPTFVTTKDSKGKEHKSLKWDFSQLQKFRFGKYTAHLVAVYDNGQQDVPIEAEVSFWVIPWRILGVILLIVLMILVGIWGVGRIIWRAIRRNVKEKPIKERIIESVPEDVDASSLAAARLRAKQAKQAAPNEPVKRGRGRPPKAVAEVPDEAPSRKRGFFGRRKHGADQPEAAPVVPTVSPVSEAPADMAPKRRGRPPKNSVPQATIEVPKTTQIAVKQPARRGRPPKAPSAAPVEPPRKRGRPPKARTVQDDPTPAPRRGRPPKK